LSIENFARREKIYAATFGAERGSGYHSDLKKLKQVLKNPGKLDSAFNRAFDFSRLAQTFPDFSGLADKRKMYACQFYSPCYEFCDANDDRARTAS
jgi:hypothetical protein